MPILHALFLQRQVSRNQWKNFCHSIKFGLDLNTGGGNLSKVNKIAALIGHCACAIWKNSACSIGHWIGGS